MAVLKGDFIGFTYNGIHSSEMGIIRTSDGNRYNEDLLPTLEHKRVPVPGGHGSYDFGSYYRDKVFPMPVAFDSLTEAQFEKLKIIFGDRKSHSLIFDESPYKVYLVKIEQKPSFKTICFDEGRKRVYKGEADLHFITSGSPFAKSRYKFKEDYTSEYIPEWSTVHGNRGEWLPASGIREQTYNGVTYDEYNEGKIPLYNPGHMLTDFILTLKFHSPNQDITPSIPAGKIFIENDAESQLSWRLIERPQTATVKGVSTEDWGIQINTKLNLIEGITSQGKTTGTVYNKYKTGGNFFTIPVGASILKVENVSDNKPKIRYDYIYF